MRKSCASPRLLKLPQAQLDTLTRWLIDEKISYTKIQAKLLADFGVVTSRTALCEFFQSHCSPLILQRQQAAAAAAINSKASDTLLEIVIDLSQPKTVRLKIIPGAGVQIEGGKP